MRVKTGIPVPPMLDDVTNWNLFLECGHTVSAIVMRGEKMPKEVPCEKCEAAEEKP